MSEWKKLTAGIYESTDGRFRIDSTWNRTYGYHWELRDRNDPDKYKGTYIYKTLRDCKDKADRLRRENG